MEPVTVFAPHDHPRLRYALHVVLERHLGLAWRLTSDPDTYRAAPPPRLNYGGPSMAIPEVRLPAGGLLFRSDREPIDLQLHWQFGLPLPFFRAELDFPFDVLAACFYWLSRYEEYQPFMVDAHGRYPSTAAHAGRWGLLHRLLVQEWAALLGETMQKNFPGLTLRPPGYRFLPTYDIDIAWAYSHRGWRGWGAAARDVLRGEHTLTAERLRVWLRGAADPFDTFDQLDRWHHAYGLHPVYFFLLADRTRFDPNANPDGPAMQALVRRLCERYACGIHPSYFMHEQPHRLHREMERLAWLSGRPVHRGRQHFLRLRLPDTYRMLLNAGIREDYSLGFSDRAGFRAGTAVPFPWYDLGREEQTPLLVYPLAVMDRTLKDYENLAPAAATGQLNELVAAVRRHGGTLVTLWHNSSFAASHGWAGWTEVYEQLLASASA